MQCYANSRSLGIPSAKSAAEQIIVYFWMSYLASFCTNFSLVSWGFISFVAVFEIEISSGTVIVFQGC